jgi:hypothetical protein
MTRNDGGVWRCKGAVQTSLHDSIVCPEGSFIKTRSGVEAGCSVFGMNCTLNGKRYSDCLCRPCIYRDEVEIFNTRMDGLGPSNIEEAMETIKKYVTDHDMREQQDRGTKKMSLQEKLLQNSYSTPAEDTPSSDTNEESSGSLPMDGEEQVQNMSAPQVNVKFSRAKKDPLLLCPQSDVCLPGVQQRSLPPLIVKDHLMRRPGSANFM